LGRPGQARLAAAGPGPIVPCPHYPRCDGCPLVGQPYTAQLRLKQAAVERVLGAALGPGAPEILPILGARTPFGYRNQAKLVLRQTRAGLLAGLYAPGTHHVVDASACAVHHPAINRIVAVTTALITAARMPIYDERTGGGALRYLVVRHGLWQRRAQVILVAARRPEGLAALAHQLRRRCPTVASIVLNLNPAPRNVLFGPRWIALVGADGIVDRFGHVKLLARAGAFLQANPWVAGRLYGLVERWVAAHGRETVIDCYAGIGGIALTVAPGAGRVFAIEENTIAADDARSNARRNGVSNLRVLAGPVERVLPLLRREIGQADAATLNPPRAGVPPDVLDEIAALGPRRIVYVSCNPETLGRDLARLATGGYRTLHVQPVDMFPQSDQIECVALAERPANRA
jgi:23S rRNA (uracil1939-C5)-methyltransferase